MALKSRKTTPAMALAKEGQNGVTEAPAGLSPAAVAASPSKVRPRPGRRSAKSSAPAEIAPKSVAVNENSPGDAPAVPSTRKPRRKAPPRPALAPASLENSAGVPDNSAAQSERDLVRTVDARLKELAALPSLQAARPKEIPARVVDGRIPPPGLRVPATEAAPLAEAEPSAFVDRGAPIPDHYGMDRIVSLVRDPYWLLVYWELKGGVLERLRFQYSAEVIDSSRWVLRARMLKDAGQSLVDVDIRAGQWYLRTVPDTALIVDLGFVDQHGDFVEVLKGNEVRTPRSAPSTVADERWMIAREELQALVKSGGIYASAEAKTPPRRGGTGEVPPCFPRAEPRSLTLFSSYLAQHAQPPPENP